MSLEGKRYTFSEVAKLARVGTSSVWRWYLTGVKGERLKSVLIGGRRFVTQSQLDEFCNQKPMKEERKIRQEIVKQKLNVRGVQGNNNGN